MYDMMKKQNFGVEIELTGITRSGAARVIANYFGTTSSYTGTCYRSHTATDRKGRTWKAMSDASIATQRKVDGQMVNASDEYSCEVVTPVLSTRTWRISRTWSARSARPAPSPTAPAASTSTLTVRTTRRPA